MTEQIQKKLHHFLAISHTMLEFAEASDWGKLSDLEKKRKALMLTIFENKFDEIDSAQVASVINDVLAKNDKISELAEKGKVTLLMDMKNQKKRTSANSAYLQNT